MTRLIDVDEIIKRSHDVIIGNGTKHRCFDTTLIHEIPTVDAVPVRHGKWIDEGYYADNTNIKAWHCSECNWHMLGYEDELFRYCPTCGARMVEDDQTDRW